MWHDLKTDPPTESGQYLVTIDVDEIAFAEVEHYFLKGDFLTIRESTKETWSERVLDSLTNDDLILRADRDGFYRLSEEAFDAEWDRTINDNPYHKVLWREMPKPPKGKRWGSIGEKLD